MKIRSIISVLLVSIMAFGTTVSAQTNNGVDNANRTKKVDEKSEKHANIEVEGVAYLNIPLKEWSSKDQTEAVDAMLLIEQVNESNLQINLKGSIEYKDTVLTFDKVGQLLRSKQVQDDMIIDFDEDRKNYSGEIALISCEIRKELIQNDLSKKNDLTGTSVRIIFFDANANDLIIFEADINDMAGIKKLSSINSKKLEIAETDVFAHKIVDPTLEFYVDDSIGTLSQTESDYEYYWGEYVYEIGGATCRHRMRLKAYASVQHPFSDTKVATGLDVIKEEIIDDWTGYESGSSAVKVGSPNDAARSTLTMYEYNNTHRDYIYQTEWDMTGYKSNGSGSFSIGLGVSYGPLSGGYSTSQAYTFEQSNMTNIYSGGSSYPYYANVTFDDTELQDEGDNYVLNYWVRNGGGSSTDSKKMKVYFDIPFYNTWNDKVDNKNFYLYLYYTSY